MLPVWLPLSSSLRRRFYKHKPLQSCVSPPSAANGHYHHLILVLSCAAGGRRLMCISGIWQT